MSNPAIAIGSKGLTRTALVGVALFLLVLLSAAARVLPTHSQGDRLPAQVPAPGSYPGSAGALGAPALASTSRLTDTEVLVLQQVAAQLSCSDDILVDGTIYHLTCLVAAGHSITVRIQRFASAVEARAAFDTMRAERPLQPFHCYPSYSWTYDQPVGDLPMRHRIQSWQADRWYIHSEAFDDTGYPIAPAPLYVSELVHVAAGEQPLFPPLPCALYLPCMRRR